MFLHPPIGACAFKTNTVSLLSGRVSCQWDWFPRKEVSVSWLLFNKCTVSIIQAFEQIPFAYRKNPELFSLLSKINQVLEFITDSQTVVQSNPNVGCFDCLVWSFFFFLLKSSSDVRCCWTCLVALWILEGHKLPPGAATQGSHYYGWLVHKDTFILVGIN